MYRVVLSAHIDFQYALSFTNQENENTMKSDKLLPTLSLALLITGCSSMITNSVKQELHMNDEAPSFSMQSYSSQLGREEYFYAQALSDAVNDFTSFKGNKFSDKEKNREVDVFIDNFKAINKHQISRGIMSAENANSIIN